MNLYLILIIVLLALSAFFSSSETALLSLSDVRIGALLKRKDKKRIARLIKSLKANPKRLLTAILVGNNLVNVSLSVIVTVYFTGLFGKAGPGIAIGVGTFLVLTLGEIIPKSVAITKTEQVSFLVAGPIKIVIVVLWPLVWFFELFTKKIPGSKFKKTITEEEVRAMALMGAEAGAIEKEEQEMIEKVLQFNDITVEDVMTPRLQMFCLESDLTLREALPSIVKSPFTRIPIYHKKLDNIVGVLYTRDCFRYFSKGLKTVKLRTIANPPIIIPEQKIIDDLFQEFQQKHIHIAIVVNEYGEVRGLVTLEDLLEELVGEIVDESDLAKRLIKKINKNIILVNGETELDQINDFFNIELPGKGTDTISGLIFEKIGHIPQKGERISFGRVGVTIKEATEKRIIEVKITKRG